MKKVRYFHSNQTSLWRVYIVRKRLDLVAGLVVVMVSGVMPAGWSDAQTSSPTEVPPTFSSQESTYQIGPQDVLQIDVCKDEILSREVTVRPDGKGRWVDNVFVERRWRSVKYGEVSLRAYDSPAALCAGLTRYFQFYHTERRHQALNRQTPGAV